VRRLPAILIGALTLSVGLLPAAAVAESSTPPAPTPSVTATVSPPVSTPTAPPVPTTPAPTTPAPTATATATATPTPTGPPPHVPLKGTFVRTPASGPVGTKIKTTSKTSCVDVDGVVGKQVEVVLLSESDVPDEDVTLVVDKVIKTDAAGAWKTEVTVPASAKVGGVYYLIAACFETSLPIDESTEPFLVYGAQDFTVTGADKAPIADPVPGDPNFTG
jgi:hypothetical protein